MVINKGDKFVAKNDMFFMNKGETAVVVETNKYGVLFEFGKNCIFVDMDTFKENFEKVVEKKPVEKKINSVTAEHVQYIMDNAEYEICTTFDKCTVVSCKLPNGFVIVESSACVDAENYDEELGAEICFSKIVDKVWELEGYKLQNEMTCDCCECENVKEGIEVNGSSIYSGILTKLYNDIKEMFPTNFDDEEEEEFDECLDTDLDCYDCTDYTCRFNPENNLRAT